MLFVFVMMSAVVLPDSFFTAQAKNCIFLKSGYKRGNEQTMAKKKVVVCPECLCLSH